jgi:hypothetical protein
VADDDEYAHAAKAAVRALKTSVLILLLTLDSLDGQREKLIDPGGELTRRYNSAAPAEIHAAKLEMERRAGILCDVLADEIDRRIPVAAENRGRRLPS